MSCFLLPKKLINEITTSMRNFWWSGQKDKQKIPWISWKKVTASKREGGLGIRDMEMFNLALVAKQGWRIIRNPSSLMARVMKAKYFRHTDFLQAPTYKNSSYAWRSILQARRLIQEGTKWIVGDGSKIRVWEDNWIHKQPAKPASGIGYSYMEFHKDRGIHCKIRLPSKQSAMESSEGGGTRKSVFNRGNEEKLLRYMGVGFTTES
ncbi:uncharacterized mitochondrial protein AtMg00310-like [Raphanus sativus]|uniref:Uncharacterized mitochondrial protein AtMg00310-like n=1 Tax=Raphanus sativus TaxID=3726 RepID=A0A9W3C090_RAPSA|nr:uncharacterized mitochondrial protein AtMg00310-like [Raphanus sativus]